MCCLQVGELTLAVSRLNNEKVMLEQSMEMEEEGIVNRLQRVIETVMARNKACCALFPILGGSWSFPVNRSGNPRHSIAEACN